MTPPETHPHITPALYVVATPIGNLGDMTLRGLDVLRAAALVACEDTRHTAHLMAHFGLSVPLLALHEHNEREASERLVQEVAAGKAVALVSDAGTPGVSDPGARAVRAMQAAGLPVVPLPGASALATAISGAGLMDARFLFAGFLSPKPAARRAELERLRPVPAALVFYEAPHRIEETVADLVTVMEPERELVIARELTKTFEQIVRLPLADAPAWLAADANRRRGEFVVLVSAPPARDAAQLDVEAERILAILLKDLPVKQAARLAAEITGAGKNALYARALALKSES